jgi:carbonic anhydrase
MPNTTVAASVLQTCISRLRAVEHAGSEEGTWHLALLAAGSVRHDSAASLSFVSASALSSGVAFCAAPGRARARGRLSSSFTILQEDILPNAVSAQQPSPEEALNRLIEGNAAFVADRPKLPDISRERRLALAQGQQPFATLVGCSDSRVGPEQLFGAGLGELFIVRTAGNNVDTAGMGSIEYSVTVLKVPLIVVLGHEKCGAVAAATDVVTKDIRFPGSIGRMIEPIIPAVIAAQRSSADGDLVEHAVEENVRKWSRGSSASPSRCCLIRSGGAN